MINKQKSILYLTHQTWKYNASLAIGSLGTIIFVGSFYYYYSRPQWHLLFLMVAGMLIITSFIIALRIKCPKCGVLWYWQALKTPVGSDGLGKLRSQKACPTCGFSDDTVT